MQQFGDYAFRDESGFDLPQGAIDILNSPYADDSLDEPDRHPEPDVSALGGPTFTPREFAGAVVLAVGVGAVVAAVLVVLFS